MTVTHQYKLHDSGGANIDCSADASRLTVQMDASGDVLHSSQTIEWMYLYFINTSASFMLTIEGSDPSIDSATQSIVAGSPRAGGVSWAKSGGDLIVTFHAPDVDSEMTWQFGDGTPVVNLKVKVRRQGTANSGDCGDWPPAST